MPQQSAVALHVPVRPDRVDALVATLSAVADERRRPQLLPFEDLPVHFARLVVVEHGNDLRSTPRGASLVFLSDIDGRPIDYLRTLAELAGEGLDEILAHCENYPDAPTVRQRADYLADHCIRTAAAYVNTVGRGVQQVRDEARLREEIEGFLDRRDWSGHDAREVRRAVRSFVAGRAGLSWALRRPRKPALRWRAKEAIHLVALLIGGLLVLPPALVVLPVWLLAIRIHEGRDRPSGVIPGHARVSALADAEDRLVQNQFSAIGEVKPGWLRRTTIVVVLWLLQQSARHVFSRGRLAGIDTIHFAQWVFLDDKRRLIFASNYDGTLESYMDDFIDRVAWGLNGAFSNGVGYPRTRWLVFEGAKDELAFKHYLRERQVPTALWYSAYGDLTALNLSNNAAIRDGLAGRRMSSAHAARWAARL